MSDQDSVGEDPAEDNVPNQTKLRRITPSPDNPSGYPLFSLKEILQYSNRQITYYIQRGAVPAPQMTAFTKAVEKRRRILDALRQTGDTSDEEG